jgi:hypothetical protein
MNQEEAVNILEQAVNAGVTKGIYTLADMVAIIDALKTIKEK